jgi:3-deoxy-D-manno-octulosonic acid kinase
MMGTVEKKIDGYHAIYAPPLTEKHLLQILPLLQKSPERNETILGGRRKIAVADIKGLGSIAIKAYARGGLLSAFVKETYFHVGEIRSFTEFRWLVTAHSLGIPVPHPLVCIWKGKVFYKCWMIMLNIGPHKTLAQISLTDENRTKQIMPVIREKIFLLARHKILHVDLHPGNLLLNDQNHPFITDFDKARYYPGNPKKLLKKYAKRWKRSVKKHHLPVLLNEIFEEPSP